MLTDDTGLVISISFDLFCWCSVLLKSSSIQELSEEWFDALLMGVWLEVLVIVGRSLLTESLLEDDAVLWVS